MIAPKLNGWVAVSGLSLALAACGGSGASETSQQASESAGQERASAASDGLQVEGLKGTLSQEEVRAALEPRMLKFATCPGKSSDLEFLWGEAGFHFTVAPDGRVTEVYTTRSTLGERRTEQCMLDVARRTRFPRPHGGGEAEFDWSLEIPADPNVREPLPWAQEHVNDQVGELGPPALQSCGGGTYTVTAYVDTDGVVMGAGATWQDPREQDALDCITQAVSGWKFPSPGSYPAKISFVLR